MDNTLAAAIVAAVVSIWIWGLSIVLGPFTEKRILKTKIETEHEYEQKKRIKNVISKYKMQLINACASLDSRFWNIYENYRWLNVDNDRRNHFLVSTEYRLFALYYWIAKTDSEMIYLDSSIADKSDLEFIKFLKLFRIVICSPTVIREIYSDYDIEYQGDHLFSDRLDAVAHYFIESGLPALDGFRNTKNLPDEFMNFLIGISPKEERHRWDVMQLLHHLTVIFLNIYGYDYQKTDLATLFKHKSFKPALLSPFIHLLKKFEISANEYVALYIKEYNAFTK